MIPIQNIYYMLSYAFRALRGNGYRRMAAESFHNSAELCAAILCRGVSAQLKRGFQREYTPFTEPLTAVRGKIDIIPVHSRAIPCLGGSLCAILTNTQ